MDGPRDVGALVAGPFVIKLSAYANKYGGQIGGQIVRPIGCNGALSGAYGTLWFPPPLQPFHER